MNRLIAIYARQSKDKKDSLSIETQLEKCKNLVPIEDEYKLYDEDKGFSGKNTKRPGVNKLIFDVKKGLIKKIIVYKLDRLSRNILDFYNLYEIMQNHNCEFISVCENFDTSSSIGRAMMGILAVFAQMERENIQQRVRDNYYFRIAECGSWPGGPAPFGFSNGVNEMGKKTLKVNEREMQAVKIAFDCYENSDLISLAKVGRILEANGFVSRKRKTFDNVTIARILQSPVYAIADKKLYKYYQIRNCNFSNSEENWNGKHSAHIVGKKVGNSNVRKYTNLKEQTIYLTNFSGIISSQQFINVQKRLESNEQINNCNSPSKMEELAGKIKCAKCGYAIKMNSAPYLSCYGRFGLHLCDVKFSKMKFQDVQLAVSLEIQKVLNDLDKISKEKNKVVYQKQNEVNDLKIEIKNLIDLIALGGLTAFAVKEEIEKRQNKINQLELDIQMSEVHGLENIKTEINFNDLDMDKKKAIVQELVDKVLLSQNGDIEILWKI